MQISHYLAQCGLLSQLNLCLDPAGKSSGQTRVVSGIPHPSSLPFQRKEMRRTLFKGRCKEGKLKAGEATDQHEHKPSHAVFRVNNMAALHDDFPHSFFIAPPST